MGSLNQLLQWSVTQSAAAGAVAADGGRPAAAAAGTAPDAATDAPAAAPAAGRGSKALAIGPPPPTGSAPPPSAGGAPTRPAFNPRDPANAAWLDAFTPDTFAAVRDLGATVADPASSAADRVAALEGLEEYASDLDYAENFHKPTVNVLDTVVAAAAADPDGAVRAAAVWVLGTAMADSPTVKGEVLERGGVALLADRLVDPDLRVVAKAAGAATGLVRHGAGGGGAAAALGPGLLGVLARGPKPGDTGGSGDGGGGGDGGWARVLFFLRHAGAMSAPWFPAAAASSPAVVAALAAALADGGVDGEDAVATEAVLAGASAAAAAAPAVASAGGGGWGEVAAAADRLAVLAADGEVRAAATALGRQLRGE